MMPAGEPRVKTEEGDRQFVKPEPVDDPWKSTAWQYAKPEPTEAGVWPEQSVGKWEEQPQLAWPAATSTHDSRSTFQLGSWQDQGIRKWEEAPQLAWPGPSTHNPASGLGAFPATVPAPEPVPPAPVQTRDVYGIEELIRHVNRKGKNPLLANDDDDDTPAPPPRKAALSALLPSHPPPPALKRPHSTLLAGLLSARSNDPVTVEPPPRRQKTLSSSRLTTTASNPPAVASTSAATSLPSFRKAQVGSATLPGQEEGEVVARRVVPQAPIDPSFNFPAKLSRQLHAAEVESAAAFRRQEGKKKKKKKGKRKKKEHAEQ